MASSSSSAPPPSEWHRAVIPGDPAGGFSSDGGIGVASGGLFSTTHDLARLGVGILNSTLLAPDETRRWMKPVSHTARPEFSVGRPWEIIRFTHASGAITDLYTKLGDSGLYSGYIALLPDYNAGFSILAAASMPTGRFEATTAVADLITSSIIPALDAQSAAEAERNFAGHIQVHRGRPKLVAYSESRPRRGCRTGPNRVVVDQRRDRRARGAAFHAEPAWPLPAVASISDPTARKVAFQLVTAVDAPKAQTPGLFSRNILGDWLNVGGILYGDIPTTLFKFDIASDGTAVAVSSTAYRVKLQKSA